MARMPLLTDTDTTTVADTVINPAILGMDMTAATAIADTVLTTGPQLTAFHSITVDIAGLFAAIRRIMKRGVLQGSLQGSKPIRAEALTQAESCRLFLRLRTTGLNCLYLLESKGKCRHKMAMFPVQSLSSSNDSSESPHIFIKLLFQIG